MTERAPAMAIIGGGIAGLTAAATLRKVGLHAHVYEQAEAFARIGAGIQMNPNAMKVLRGLGLEPRIRTVGFAPQVGYNREWDSGKVTYLHPMGPAIEQRFGAPDISLHRAELHAALMSLNPPDILHFNKKLIGLDRAGERLRLAFADGGEAQVDAVIGADGVHSTVLEILLGAGSPRFTGQVAYRAIYRTELLGTEIDDRVKWWGPDRHIVSYKVDPRPPRALFPCQHTRARFQDRVMVGARRCQTIARGFCELSSESARDPRSVSGCAQMGPRRARSSAAVERGPRCAYWRRLPSHAALYGARGRLSHGGCGRYGALP